MVIVIFKPKLTTTAKFLKMKWEIVQVTMFFFDDQAGDDFCLRTQKINN